MPNELTIEISDIVACARARQANVTLAASPPDDRFLVAGASPDMTLDVTVGPIPELPTGRVVFRGRETWSLVESAGGRRLEFGDFYRFKGEQRAILLRDDKPGGDLIVSPTAEGAPTREPRKYVVDPFAFPGLELLMYWELSRRGGCFFHSSSVILGDRGILFAGLSGAGKSTISGLFEQAGGTIFSDDRNGLTPGGGRFQIHGTPWHGTPSRAKQLGARLTHFVFIEHGSANVIEPLPLLEACARVLTAGCPPYFSRELMDQVAGTCERIARAVPCYRLAFVPDPSVVDAVLGFID